MEVIKLRDEYIKLGQGLERRLKKLSRMVLLL